MAGKNYVGVAPLTMVNVGAGGYAYVYANMPVPDGASTEEIKRLVDEGFIAEGEPGKETASAGDGDSGPANIDDILKDVGEDPEKAKVALEQENAQAKPRKTLVAKLEAIANPGS